MVRKELTELEMEDVVGGAWHFVPTDATETEYEVTIDGVEGTWHCGPDGSNEANKLVQRYKKTCTLQEVVQMCIDQDIFY